MVYGKYFFKQWLCSEQDNVIKYYWEIIITCQKTTHTSLLQSAYIFKSPIMVLQDFFYPLECHYHWF